MSLQQTHAQFKTTSWTLIEAVRHATHADHARALDTLVSRYWPPVYASLRRMGRSREDAAELTQSFFAEVVLGRRLFDQADAGRGKLRSLLLTAVKRHVIDQHRRHVARPDRRVVSPDAIMREEGFLAREPQQDVDAIFERRWAIAVLEEALARCARYFDQMSLPRHWAAFEARVVRPAIGACSAPSLAEVAGELGFDSEVHVASAMKVVRKRFRMALKAVAAETATDPSDQDAEYQRVVALLAS
jgi:RNA polymerase sigma-70 factor (ECF subfamily)